MTSAIDYEYWTTDADTGETIPQSSSPARIADMVALADIEPGMRVLEIGTGTGYTAAVLAEKVGASGHVVSVDVDQELVTRAAELHKKSGNTHVEIHHADGTTGWENGAPYDRIIGWTTPHVLPDPWVRQSAHRAVIVTPVKIADIANAHAVIRCRVEHGKPAGASAQPGSFIEMTPEPVTDFGQPLRYVDSIVTIEAGERAWISISGHRVPPEQADAITRQLAAAEPQPEWIDPACWREFTAYMLDTLSDGEPISASTGTGQGFGFTTSDSAVLVLRDGSVAACGTAAALATLRGIRDAWEQAGQPGYDAATVAFTAADDGWRPSLRY